MPLSSPPDAAAPATKHLPCAGPRALYETHFGFVWRNLRRLGVPESVAEDAAQDVFLTVHRRYSSYDARWSRVETWLFGIVIRVASDYRRARRRRRQRLDSAADVTALLERATSGEQDPEQLAAKGEAVALLEQLLDMLDARKRAVLVMVDIEQLTVPEAAEALGVNVNTAYWRLRAARMKFQRALSRFNAGSCSRKGRGRR
jgi:RNA polymerase sigma-70 factor (ECF subfamily)